MNAAQTRVTQIKLKRETASTILIHTSVTASRDTRETTVL